MIGLHRLVSDAGDATFDNIPIFSVIWGDNGISRVEGHETVTDFDWTKRWAMLVRCEIGMGTLGRIAVSGPPNSLQLRWPNSRRLRLGPQRHHFVVSRQRDSESTLFFPRIASQVL